MIVKVVVRWWIYFDVLVRVSIKIYICSKMILNNYVESGYCSLLRIIREINIL